MLVILALGCTKNSCHNYITLHLDCNIFLQSYLSCGFIFLFAFISLFFERVESSKMLPLLNQQKLAVVVDAQSVTDGA